MTIRSTPKRTRRWLWLVAISGTAITFIAASVVIRGPTLLLWNASASVPEGLYVVAPNAPLRVGDLAVSMLPARVQRLAADRQYLPPDVLLIKPVAATAGSEICRHGRTLFLDAAPVGDARTFDRLHRLMPEWQGCRIVADSEIFLMNPAVPDSFDGRYFGPTPLGLAKGRAIPLLIFAQASRR